ncbi:MAG: signal peptide peptidase SppA [Myxococcota bacterium]|nr:signal peptide peptidase SppA [Myxococcota bacterium]
MNKNTKLVLWLIAILSVVGVALIIGISLIMSGQTPNFMEKPKWLHLKISPLTAEAPGNESIFAAPDELPPLSTEIARMIHDAKDDENILGIHFQVSPNSLGWAQLQEIRDALIAFQDAGKTCKAWSESFDNRSYYLAAPCDEVYLNETGVTLVNGLSITQTYYAQMFEKLDVKPNFAHVGDFKSAVEPYERTGPSEAASEATNTLLDSLYQQLLDGFVNESRGMTAEKVEEMLKNPPITPQDALKRGMVTDLLYKDEFMDLDDIERISTSSYLRKRRNEWQYRGRDIAVLYASGAIMNGDSGSSLFGGEIIGDSTVIKQLEEIEENASLKAVVLRVNSPGGSGSASDNIWHAVNRIKEKGIPVVVSMGNYAASGGYYISMNADYIYAEPGTITGSIGVFGGKINIRGLYQKLGMDMHTYKRGEFSMLFSEVEDFSDAERAKYEEFLQSFYDTFVTKASEGRGKTYEEIHAVAQGRVWTGIQAKERGLVDELGGLQAAIRKAAELAKIEEYGIEVYPKRKSFFEQLVEDLDQQSRVQVEVPLYDESLKPVISHLHVLEKVMEAGKPAAMMESVITIQ